MLLLRFGNDERGGSFHKPMRIMYVDRWELRERASPLLVCFIDLFRVCCCALFEDVKIRNKNISITKKAVFVSCRRHAHG